MHALWSTLVTVALVAPWAYAGAADSTAKNSLSSYVLGPNDQISVDVVELPEISAKSYRIDSGGSISLPLIGRVQAAGLTLKQFEDELAARLKTQVRNPHLVTGLVETRSQPVSVMGFVNIPGTQQLTGTKTLFDVIAMAGGLKPEAGDMIKITRVPAEGPLPLKNAVTDKSTELTAESLDPKRAAAVGNAITTAFVEQDLESRVQAGRQTSAWLSKQLDELGEKLRRSENDLQAFISKEHFLIEGTDGVAETGLRQVQGELAHAQSERIAKQSTLAAMQSMPDAIEAGLLADPTLQQYKVQLTALKKQLAELEATYAPDYYKIPPVRAEIAAVQQAYDTQRQAVRSQLENDYQAAQRREGLLQTEYNQHFAATADQTSKLVRYN